MSSAAEAAGAAHAEKDLREPRYFSAGAAAANGEVAGLAHKCDLHTHTVFSRHAYSTVLENMAAADAAGLEVLGIADHYSSMIATPPFGVEDYQHFCNMRCWPRRTAAGALVLRGAEADIVDVAGHLWGHNIQCGLSLVGDVRPVPRTLFEEAMAQTDYVIASIHGKDFAAGLTRREASRMYCAALEHERVFMIAHVMRSGVPIDIDSLVACAAECGKCLEINEYTLVRSERVGGRCAALAQACAEAGVGVCVSSDAHIATTVGAHSKALAMLASIDFPPELLVSRSGASLLAALDRALGSDLAGEAAQV
jgi:putative hydrolase